jgi:O-antigen/teichoic acid export membrane protein
MESIKNIFNNILKRGTSIFETDLHYVVKGSFWIVSAQALASFTSFFLAIAFAHFLSKEDYGNYKYILSVAGLISAISLSGLSTSIVQSVARGFENIFNKSFWLNIKWSIGMILTAIGISGYYFVQKNYLLGSSMLVVALLAPIVNGSLLYRSFLNGKKEFRATSLYNSILTIVPALAVFGTMVYFPNPFWIVLVYFGSNALVAGFIHFYVRAKWKPNKQIDPESDTYSKHLSAINILDMIATNLDKVILFQHLGATSLAMYSFATAIPEQIRNLFKAIPTLAVPKLAEKTNEDIQKVIYKKIFKLFLITIPVIILYYFAAPFIYRLIFPQYIEAIVFSQVFAIILLMEGGLSGSVFEARMAIREQYILNVASNVVKIVLLYILMILYGIWGVIFARIISRFIGFGIALYLLRKLK